jgi:hypothetical protein
MSQSLLNPGVGLQKVDPLFDEQPLCQSFDVWPMPLNEIACLADHFVDESFGMLGIPVSRQQREVRYLHAVIGITPRPGPDVLALCKAGGNEDLQCMFDLVVVASNERILATGVSQSIAVRHYGDVEAPIAKPH